MNRLHTTLLGITLAGLGCSAALAGEPASREIAVDPQAPAAGAYEEVDSITVLTHPYRFEVLDDDSLILWRTPFDPYLVELRVPSPDLRFAWGIGVSSWAGRIHARFDDVHVGGLRYPIDKIYKLDRDEAERLGRES